MSQFRNCILRFLFLGLMQIVAGQQNIQLMVLGTAQDAGAPQLGCEQSCCNDREHPEPVSSLALYDSDNGKTVLFDASPDLPLQLKESNQEMGKPFSPLAAIYLTHAHMGHYSGLLYLGRESANTRDLPVFALSRMRRFLESNGPWSQLVQLENIALQTLQPGESTQPMPGLQVTPLIVPHRDEFSETAAFLIKGPKRTALYLPDIDKWHQWEIPLKDILREVDYAFLDATFYNEKELPGRDLSEIPHPTVQETMLLLKDLPAAQRSKVYFIHMNHTNPMLQEESEASREVKKQGFHIARTGLTLSL